MRRWYTRMGVIASRRSGLTRARLRPRPSRPGATAGRASDGVRRGAERRPPSDGQSLAALGAPTLERQATGTRLHAGAEAVGAGALALLGLVGALHGRRAGSVTGSAV